MSKFQASLNRFRRRWCFGRLLFALLVLIALCGVGLLVHGWVDFKLALSSEARERFNFVVACVLGAIGLVWIARILMTPRAKAAALADQKLGDQRQMVLAAQSLAKVEPETEMERFHIERTLDGASEELGKLPAGSRMPFRAMGFALLALLLVGGVMLALRLAAPKPFKVVAARVLNPYSELPPYSPLVFSVTPDAPSAVYGGEAIVQVEITGGEIEEDVVCLIRNTQTGVIEEATAYREGRQKFARKFEKALAPLEFAFATGRARSDWHKLDVVLEPKVSSAMVTVVPPAYTGRQTQSYPLDSNEIKVLEGSTITLQLESNRPLSGGEARIRPLDKRSTEVPEIVSGERSAESEVSFTWVAHRSTKLSAMVRDIRSTPAAKPVQLTIKAVPDQVPVVDLSSPEQVVLATPRTELPFFGEVEDDHGLAKVSLVRSLLGYRDRSRTLADALVKKDFDFKEPLKLASLGVEPGQMLEFYLEAMDRNPSLLGVGVSDVVRVQIISEEAYAERLRAQAEIKEFTARYRALAAAVAEARKSLRAMDEAADIGDREEFEKARKAAEEAHAKAQELAEKIAKDFKAFSMEDRLAELAKETSEKLGQNKEQLAKGLDLSSGEAKARRAIDEMQERLGDVQERAEGMLVDAEEVAKAAKVMEMAATFQRIYKDQESLVQRMGTIAKEVAKGTTRNTVQLANLARLQESNREELQKFAKELKKRSDDLPEVFGQMRTDAEAFLEKMEELDIPDPMQAAADEARRGSSNDAATNAMLALSLMQQLMDQPGNGFCEMCKGGGPPRFQVKPDVNQTMEEMMQALMSRGSRGQGKGKGTGGAGGGSGGSGQDGYSIAGNSANVPVYGPDRLMFNQPSGATGRGGGTSGSAKKRIATQQPGTRVNPTEHRDSEHAELAPENIPTKYESAVKRYFSQETATESNAKNEPN